MGKIRESGDHYVINACKISNRLMLMRLTTKKKPNWSRHVTPLSQLFQFIFFHVDENSISAVTAKISAKQTHGRGEKGKENTAGTACERYL